MNPINAHLNPTSIPKLVGGNGPNYAGTPELKSKFSEFSSLSGSIVSFEDTKQTSFLTLSRNLYARKRIVTRGEEQKVFLILELPADPLPRIAAIAEEDFPDLFKAIDVLQNDALIDASSTSNYLEKYYTTEDNFRIGYTIANKTVKWYIDLNIRRLDSVFYIKDINTFVSKLKDTIK